MNEGFTLLWLCFQLSFPFDQHLDPFAAALLVFLGFRVLEGSQKASCTSAHPFVFSSVPPTTEGLSHNITMARRLLPLLDRVLVEKVAARTKTEVGIILPESAASQVLEGLVVAVGPGKRADNGDIIPVDIKEGDKVLLPEYGGQSVKMGDKELHLFSSEDILAKFSSA